MGFLDSIKLLLGGGSGRDATGYWIHVRCRRCGEVIRTRVDLYNDLTPSDEGGFVVSKTLVGSQRCFERIETTLVFDANRRLVEREIVRGEFITPQEFDAAGSN